jgi:hypothetical protein
MSQNNFVVQDVVSHVYCESDYGAHRVILNTLRKIIKKMWLFLVIILLSAGIGYVAVYLPETMARHSEPSLGGMESGEIKKKHDNLSDEQKKELMKQFGGQR